MAGAGFGAAGLAIASYEWIAAITMVAANLIALVQSNVKRMLAYSSIAHAGYLLVAMTAANENAAAGILFYLLVYTLMNLGAFLFVVAINNHLRSEELTDYAGLGFRAPWLASMMFVFLISLTGLPPTAGFIGKFFLFKAVLAQEWYWLAILAGLNSVISLFYYMRVTKAMFFTAPSEEDGAAAPLSIKPLEYVVLAALCIPTIGLGIWWGPVRDFADQAIARFSVGI